MTGPSDTVRPLLRTRQYRQFTDEPLTASELEAITEVARWSGSSRNSQPWRFVVIRDVGTLRAIHASGLPPTRSLETAMAAIAIVLPASSDDAISDAFDEGRAAERMLVAASMLGLGAGIAWLRPSALQAIRPLIALPEDRIVRTVVALGHPTEAARRPKSAAGEARRSREEAVFDERWPADRD